MLDEDLNTRWADRGIGQYIEFDLGGEHSLQATEIAWYKGNERKASFDVMASTDGENWTRIFHGQSRGNTLDFERYDTPATAAHYVRIVNIGQGYYVSIDAYNDPVTLYRMDDGLTEIASTSADIEPNVAYTLKIQAQGTHFKIWLNDSVSPVLEVSEHSFPVGGFGLKANNVDAVFNNFRITVSVLNRADNWHDYPEFS